MQEFVDFIKSRQPVNLAIVLINILVFIVLSIMGDTQDGYFMLQHGAEYAPLVVEQREYYRLFTCMFLHFGVQHLFFNMLILVYLGDTLEKLAGKVRFLVIYLGGGIVGNIVSVIWDMHTENFAVSAGASGAIFSVIGALVAIVILNHRNISEIMGRNLLVMALFSLLEGLTATGIDNCAHIGGLLCGLILAFLFHRRLKLSPEEAKEFHF